MRKSGWIICFLLMMFSGKFNFSSGQNNEYILIRGKISEASTGKPLKASVTFQSYPDASEVYIEESNDSTGLFEVYLHKKNKYVIEVGAQYYKPEIDTINVTSDTAGMDFELLSVRPGELLRLHKIYFAQGDYHIQDSSIQELSEIALLLNQYPEMKIQLEGHTDRLGGRKANLELSENRVEAIKRYLMDQGIHHKRIKTRAFGESRPISTENTDESRKLNRRVEVRILSI